MTSSALSLRLYGVDVTPHAKGLTSRERKALAAATAAAGGVGPDADAPEGVEVDDAEEEAKGAELEVVAEEEPVVVAE
mgnify:CR=1 FL=1